MQEELRRANLYTHAYHVSVDSMHFSSTGLRLIGRFRSWACCLGLAALAATQVACSEDTLLGWEQGPTLTDSQLDAVWGTSASDVWIVGHKALAFHYDGQDWKKVSTGATGTIFAIWGSSPDRYWAGDIDGQLHLWDGSTWTADPWFAANNTDIIGSISGSGPNDVWVSTGLKLFHWDGAAWAVVPRPNDELVDEVFAVGPGEVWVSGDQRNLHRKVGANGWETFVAPGDGGVFIWNDIIGCSADDVWAIGFAVAAGSFAAYGYHFDGTSWSDSQFYEDPGIAPGSLEGIWCQSSNDVWAVGSEDSHHFNGKTWEHGQFEFDSMLAIWGAPNKELWSVGSVGAIYHRPAP